MHNALLTGALTLLNLFAPTPDPAAHAVLDTALARMGGREALRAVHRVQIEAITEWQRTTLDPRPATPVLGYELSREMRDYTRPAWRYSRRFFGVGVPAEIVNVIVDSLAATAIDGKWRPQNVAYVDERDEVFTFAPERIVTLAREAADARLLPDTIMRGVRYARVSATVGRFRPALFFRRGDGLLALARFRAGQPNDFGLVPWGEMDVDVWYSGWQRNAEAGISVPMQLDVYRVGVPYKRYTMTSLRVNPDIPADSFVIADSLKQAFLATARRPMHDLPLAQARIADGHFALFGTPGTPAGAVKLGGAWLLIETGAAPLSIERSVAFLRSTDGSAFIAGTLVTSAMGAGGLPWVMRQRIPSWVAGSAKAYTDATLRGWAAEGPRPQVVENDRWIRVGTDSLRVEMIEVPDFPRTAVLYAPSLRWVYAWTSGAVQMEHVAAHAKRRGWQVERVGSMRDFAGEAGSRASTDRRPVSRP